MRTPPRYSCPALRPNVRPTARTACLRFYSTEQGQIALRIRTTNTDEAEIWQPKEQYPRIKKQEAVLDYHTFKERYKKLGRGESKPEDEVVVRGISASSPSIQVGLAHAVKEEYGRFELRAQSWDSLTCSKTASLSS